MKKFPYVISDDIVIRVPRYSFRNSLNYQNIDDIFNDDVFLEAIYIASPILYQELTKLKEGNLSENKKERILISLQKYYSRMFSRCTPFGLFSTCSIAKWKNCETSLLFSEQDFYRHTRLDMSYLKSLINNISNLKSIKDKLFFYPNSSIQKIENEIKYCEYYTINNQRKNRISAIKNNPYIQKIINVSNKGMTLSDISLLVSDNKFNKNDIFNLLLDLVSSQVLTNELEIDITGDDHLETLIHTLRNKNFDSKDEEILTLISNLETVNKSLKKIDDNKNNKISDYKQIVTILEGINIPIDESRIFHVDSYHNSNDSFINETIKQQLIETLTLLNSVHKNSTYESEPLELFKKKFLERYDNESISLIEVLDYESGIGYPINKLSYKTPLISDINSYQQSENTNFTVKKSEKWKLELLKEANYNQRYNINLNEDDFDISKIDWNLFPPSLSVLFKVINNKENIIALDGIFGPSAISILGRFGNGNSSISNLIKNIAKKEEEQNPDVIFADFVHDADDRACNVILHPKIRSYEIPYMAKTSLKGVNKINIKDIYIKIENNEIILFSKSLRKRIIPTKNHMHNHIGNTTSVYHFLCDLFNYTSNNRIINFSWGMFSNLYFFLPRVTFKNVILSLATWNFNIDNFKHLYDLSDDYLNQSIQSLRIKYNLPNKMVYIEGDNELFIDFNNLLSIKSWLQTIRQKGFIQLKEFLWQESSSNLFINQCVASFIKSEVTYTKNDNITLHSNITEKSELKKEYEIGSEWIYYKLYCNSQSADYIISNYLRQIVQILKDQNLIDKWFFIRYMDPENHLRVRFHINDNNNIGRIIQLLNSEFEKLNISKLVWKIQIDSYIREIDRYGRDAIEICESIFHIDSETAMSLTTLLIENEKERWLSGIKGIDNYLSVFQLSLDEKIEFTQKIRNSFYKEFDVNKETKNKINIKYRKYKTHIFSMMNSKSLSQLQIKVHQLLNERNLFLVPLVESIRQMPGRTKFKEIDNNLVASLIHMMLNRIISHKERTYEMVLYDFLNKYYLSKKAIE